MRLVTLGVGAMNSPQHAPAGLLVAHGGVRVMIDGGPQAEPEGRLAAWLVTDERGELMPAIRRSAAAHGLVPQVRSLRLRGLVIEPRAVIHTSHPSYGYRIRAGGRTVVWAPEFPSAPRVGARRRSRVRGGRCLEATDPVRRRRGRTRRRAGDRPRRAAFRHQAPRVRAHRPPHASRPGARGAAVVRLLRRRWTGLFPPRQRHPPIGASRPPAASPRGQEIAASSSATQNTGASAAMTRTTSSTSAWGNPENEDGSDQPRIWCLLIRR